jgi:hypothetical protein
MNEKFPHNARTGSSSKIDDTVIMNINSVAIIGCDAIVVLRQRQV